MAKKGIFDFGPPRAGEMTLADKFFAGDAEGNLEEAYNPDFNDLLALLLPSINAEAGHRLTQNEIVWLAAQQGKSLLDYGTALPTDDVHPATLFVREDPSNQLTFWKRSTAAASRTLVGGFVAEIVFDEEPGSTDAARIVRWDATHGQAAGMSASVISIVTDGQSRLTMVTDVGSGPSISEEPSTISANIAALDGSFEQALRFRVRGQATGQRNTFDADISPAEPVPGKPFVLTFNSVQDDQGQDFVFFQGAERGWTQQIVPGQRGPAGTPGAAGADGADGEDGYTPQPTVSGAGELTWAYSRLTSAPAPPAPVNIRGPQGPAGPAGGGGNALPAASNAEVQEIPATVTGKYVDPVHAQVFVDARLATDAEMQTGTSTSKWPSVREVTRSIARRIAAAVGVWYLRGTTITDAIKAQFRAFWGVHEQHAPVLTWSPDPATSVLLRIQSGPGTAAAWTWTNTGISMTGETKFRLRTPDNADWNEQDVSDFDAIPVTDTSTETTATTAAKYREVVLTDGADNSITARIGRNSVRDELLISFAQISDNVYVQTAADRYSDAAEVAANTAAINVNRSNIATNTAAIGTNATGIRTNATAIAALPAPIPTASSFPDSPTEQQQIRITGSGVIKTAGSLLVPERHVDAGGTVSWGWVKGNAGYGSCTPEPPGINAILWVESSTTLTQQERIHRLVVTREHDNPKLLGAGVLGDIFNEAGTSYPLARIRLGGSNTDSWESSATIAANPFPERTVGRETTRATRVEVNYSDGTATPPDVTYLPGPYAWTGVELNWSALLEFQPQAYLDAFVAAGLRWPQSALVLPRTGLEALFDAPAIGLSVSGGQSRLNPLHSVSESFDLDVSNTGSLLVNQRWTFASPVPANVGFGTAHAASIRQFDGEEIPDIVAAAVLAVGGTGGVQFGNDLPVYQGSTKIGDVQLWIGRTAENLLTYQARYVRAAAGPSFSIGLHMSVDHLISGAS